MPANEEVERNWETCRFNTTGFAVGSSGGGGVGGLSGGGCDDGWCVTMWTSITADKSEHSDAVRGLFVNGVSSTRGVASADNSVTVVTLELSESLLRNLFSIEGRLCGVKDFLSDPVFHGEVTERARGLLRVREPFRLGSSEETRNDPFLASVPLPILSTN